MINEFPEGKCSVCGADDWWYRMKEPWQTQGPIGYSEWLCGRCKPPGDPLVKLKYRVIKGNYKLNKALEQIKGMGLGEERDAALEKFNAAVPKLKALCDELKAQGVTECLYIENGKKLQRCLDDESFHCTVCPNSYWWEKELFELDKKKHPEVWKD